MMSHVHRIPYNRVNAMESGSGKGLDLLQVTLPSVTNQMHSNTLRMGVELLFVTL